MGLCTIIAVEDTFLRIFDKPKKVRLSKQVIDFNYAHLSPFKNGGHLYYQADARMYVWYLKQPLAAKNTIHIPEGYLIFRFFRDRRNAVILFPRNGVQNALVISNGELVAQVTLQGSLGQEECLDLLRREYSLKDTELIRLEATARFPFKLMDLPLFAHLEFSPGNLLEKTVALAKIPIIATLLITSGFTCYQVNRLEGKVADKKAYLARLKRENAPVQSALEDIRDQNGYWRNFIAREQAFPDFHRCLAQLSDVVARNGGYLNIVEFTDNRLTVWTGLKISESALVKELLATGLFLDVKLISSTKDGSKPDFSIYNLSITLKPAAKGGQA